MARREIEGTRSLVTGASSGIGRAIAVELVRQGARCVLLARSEDRLAKVVEECNALQGAGQVEVVAGDVTDAAVRKLAIEKSVVTYGGLDAVINNAGVGSFGRFSDSSPDRLRRIMEVNFFAAAELIRESLPALLRGTNPIVVNVGSILGHRGIPRMHEYCTSKFAMQGFSQSLRIELRAEGVDLLMVSPGTTDTEFYDNVVHGRGNGPWNKGRGTPVAVVAKKTVRAMQLGKREIVPNLNGRLLLWANRHAPHWVDRVLERFA